MRIAYLDCFAGISGDMFLGALLDAGVPLHVMQSAIAALDLGATLEVETVDRSGISSTKAHVLEKGRLADGGGTHSHAHDEGHSNEAPTQEIGHEKPHSHKAPKHTDEALPQHTHEHSEHEHTHGHANAHALHEHRHSSVHDHEPHQHEHAPEHTHSHASTHEHEEHPHEHAPGKPHVHGRSLTVIRNLIQAAAWPEPVKQRAIHTFELLGRSEAKIHNVPIDQIHFHEVGAVDAIVDIVAACAGIEHLNASDAASGPANSSVQWFASPVNVGGGMVVCAHGTFPVPAPATADLLREVPTYSAHVQKELVTPTGAALLRALDPTFGPQPAMKVQSIGYGAGTRDPRGFPNVLRLSIGESATDAASLFQVVEEAAVSRHAMPAANAGQDTLHSHQEETVTVLETALDDATPQVLAHVAERALAMGALDVMLTPVIMKKGRPGTLFTVLCNGADAEALQGLLLRETSTLGVRMHREHRFCLDRSHAAVSTPFGDIRIKLGMHDGQELNAAPEFEDCRAAAAKYDAPVKVVMQSALAAHILAKSALKIS